MSTFTRFLLLIPCVLFAVTLLGQPLNNQMAIASLEPSVFSFLPQHQLDHHYSADCEAAALNVPGVVLSLPEAALAEPTLVQLELISSFHTSPAPGEIINLISNRKVIRVGPNDIRTQTPFSLKVELDRGMMPTWADINDLHAYAYSKFDDAWKEVLVTAVDKDNFTINIESDKFADFIAGVIQSPEHPSASVFTQTEIKDFKAVAPNVGFTDITTPSANNRGTANISYPLTLPPGRAGMMPAGQINYSSDAGNGPFGMGWSYSTPSITIDTRWGVPEFHGTKESETYLHEGGQLFPVANREDWVPRVRDRSFRPRREQDFTKIIRHGDETKEYWWEVIQKDGTREFYGGTPESGLRTNAILKTGDGHVATWFLTRRQDANGNNIVYTYRSVTDTGEGLNYSRGVNLYPKNIYYTGYGEEKGYFSIHFKLDKDLREGYRADAFDDCSLGFKRSTAHLLREIIIKTGNSTLRTYDLKYSPGTLGKQLLRSITHVDKSENTFFEHKFKYYDDLLVNNQFTPLFSGKATTGVRDRLQGNLTVDVGRTDEPSMLGGNRSKNFYAGIAVTIGPPGSSVCKNKSGGFSYTFSRSAGHGINSFLDINGDGRPDKVFVDDGSLKFRTNLGLNEDGKVEFSDRSEPLNLPVFTNIDNFSKSVTKSHSYGPEATLRIGSANLSIGGYVSKSTTKTKTKHKVYFEDFNSDGLIDLVFNNLVYFNYLVEGIPTLTRESSLTPNPIRTGAALSPELAFDDAEDLEEGEEPVSFEEANPLHDVVRAWRVPFDGHVKVSGFVRLIEQDNAEFDNYTQRDGVVAIIEHDEDEEWKKVIDKNNFSRQNINQVIRVRKDKMLFFRLQSKNDGAYDQVEWDPLIEYIDEDTGEPMSFLDPEGRNYYCYRASTDFLLASPQQIGMPSAGEIRISGPISKGVVTDTVKLQVIKLYKESEDENAEDVREILLERTLLPLEEIEEIFVQDTMVNEHDRLVFSLTTHSNVDWRAVNWEPTIQYLRFRNDDGSFSSALNSDGTPITDPIEAAVTPTMFNHLLSRRPRVHRVDTSGGFTAIAGFQNTQMTPVITSYIPDEDIGEPAPSIMMVLKGPGRIYGAVEVINGATTMPQAGRLDIPYGLVSSDSIYVELLYSSQRFAEWNDGVVTINMDGNRVTPNVYARNSLEDFAFGSLYRSWGQFAYRGEGDAGREPIKLRKIREALKKHKENAREFSRDPDELNEQLNPANDDVALFYVSTKDNRWQGYDELTYAGPVVMSSSRLGEDNDLSADGNVVDSRLTAATKISKTKSKGFSGNFSGLDLPGEGEAILGPDMMMTNPVPGSASFNKSKTRSYQHTLTLDINKDGYPDEIANGQVQLSLPWGGRREGTFRINHPSHRSEATVAGVDLGGTVRQAKVTNTYNSVNTSGQNHDLNQSSGQNVASTSGSYGVSGLSVNHSFANGAAVGVRQATSKDKDKTTHSWIDINGDGIPDKVEEDGLVSLGLGRKFTPASYYDFSAIRKGVNITETMGATLGGGLELLGIKDKNACKGSWTIGATLIEDINFSTYAHQDVTGDGLPDLLEVDDNDDLYVRINLGREYMPRRLWKERFRVDAGYTASESLNGAFTICFNIIFIRICINPKGGVGRAVSSTRTRIADIDGDGFPDLLESDKEDEITYHRSRIGRTDKLMMVESPLGNTLSLNYDLKPSSYERPSAQYVLAGITRTDGLSGDGAEPATYAFSYENPVHDRKEREFYGYGKVTSVEFNTETNQAYRTQTQTFANDTYYLQGLLLNERMTDAEGNTWSTMANRYEVRRPNDMSTLPIGFDDVGQSAYVALTQVQSSEHEGNETALRTRVISYAYDDVANILKYEDRGDGSDMDYVRAEIVYHPITANAVANAPQRLSVFTRDGTLLRRREADIDAAGNTLAIRNFITPGNSIETTMDYDAYGNLTNIIRPPNLHGQRYNLEFTYDDRVNTYPTKVKDAFGYTSTTTYNYDYGLPLVSTDINQNQIRRTYDDKGRLLTLTGPRELINNKPYTIAMEYHPLDEGSEVPYAICKHYDEEHDQDILTYTFIDGLGRPIQVKKTAVIWDEGSGENNEMMTVSGKQIFDAFGRTVSAYHPTLAPAATAQNYIAAADGVSPTTTTYDVLGRKLTQILPDGAVMSTAHGIQQVAGRPLTYLELTDPLGNRKEIYADLRGRQLQKIAHGPDGEITTNFDYNLVSELLKVTDNDGNETRYSYDLLGRKTTFDHPATGLTTLTYDQVGNVLTKSTPNIRERIGPNAVIHYDYEYERLKSVAYPENYQNNVRYTYGGPGASFNRVGRVVLQEDGSGAQEFFYGPLGEGIKTIRTVVVNPTSALTYVSEATYDSWNRVQTMTYPDGERVDYAYNRAGKLNGLTGVRFGENYQYVDAVGYDEFEARTFLRLGNGTEHRYDYEAERRRLRNMKASGSNAGTFMDNTYTYDDVDNILSLVNTATPNDGQIGGSCKATYQYDELYRLTEADGTFNRFNREETFSLSMAYDNVHNIRAKNQLRQRDGVMLTSGTYVNDYEMSGDRPFLPSRIGDKDYAYDANGNLTSVSERSRFHNRDLFWDEENRLMAVQEEGYLSRYTYDAAGERIIKSHGPTRGMAFNGAGGGFTDHTAEYTAYVSPFFVAGKDRFTKHYFIEGQRISSKIGQGQFNNNTANPGRGRLTAGNLDFTARIAQLQRDLIRLSGENLIPYHPDQPFHYALPQQTGEQYPALFPDTIQLVRGEFARPGLPPGPGSIHPAWEWRQTNFDTVRAGFGLVDTFRLPREVLQYYYHSDHLGSAAYITDVDGDISQFTTYTPFGETFVGGQRTDGNGADQPYLFNGKELDRETGLYYYGARYYDPVASLWTAADPLLEKFPGWSPYNYVMQNPVKLVDPDGENAAQILNGSVTIVAVLAANDITVIGFADDWLIPIVLSVGATAAGLSVLLNEASDIENEEAPQLEEKKKNPKKEAREAAKKVRDQQPKSEGYVKWKGKQLEKAKNKDARRKAHDQKQRGSKDRTKEEIDFDYNLSNTNN